MDRRTLIATFAVGLGGAVLAPMRRSTAADLPHLDVKDPAAAAKGYVEDAGSVDVKKHPDFVKGSSCENCLLLQGSAGAAYRPCSLFPGKSVSVKGWCSGWSPEI